MVCSHMWYTHTDQGMLCSHMCDWPSYAAMSRTCFIRHVSRHVCRHEAGVSAPMSLCKSHLPWVVRLSIHISVDRTEDIHTRPPPTSMWVRVRQCVGVWVTFREFCVCLHVRVSIGDGRREHDVPARICDSHILVRGRECTACPYIWVTFDEVRMCLHYMYTSLHPRMTWRHSTISLDTYVTLTRWCVGVSARHVCIHWSYTVVMSCGAHGLVMYLDMWRAHTRDMTRYMTTLVTCLDTHVAPTPVTCLDTRPITCARHGCIQWSIYESCALI